MAVVVSNADERVVVDLNPSRAGQRFVFTKEAAISLAYQLLHHANQIRPELTCGAWCVGCERCAKPAPESEALTRRPT